MIEFDQTELIPADWSVDETGLAEYGLMYVPTDCEDDSESCYVVFALHGCGGDAQTTYDGWGLNEVASTNQLIIIYPESECWDNHGDYDSDNYLTKSGLYPQFFMNIISALTDEDFEKPSESTLSALLGYQMTAVGVITAYLFF